MGQSYRKRSSAPAAPPTSSDCGPMYRLQGRSMLPGKIVLSSPGTAGSTTDVKILGEFEAQQGDDVLTEDRLHEGTVTKGGPGRAYAAFDVPKDAAQADVFNTYLSTGPGVLVGDKGELQQLSDEEAAARCAQIKEADGALMEKQDEEDKAARLEAGLFEDEQHANIPAQGSVEEAVGEATLYLYDNDATALRALLEKHADDKQFRKRLRQDSRGMMDVMADEGNEEVARILKDHGIWRKDDSKRFKARFDQAHPTH